MTTTTVTEKVTADLTAAMKAKDAAKTSALRMAKAALMNREIDKKAPLDDTEALAVIRTLVKQREDSIFQFRKANRPELVEKEEAELAVLRAYLPAEASRRRDRQGGRPGDQGDGGVVAEGHRQGDEGGAGRAGRDGQAGRRQARQRRRSQAARRLIRR